MFFHSYFISKGAIVGVQALHLAAIHLRMKTSTIVWTLAVLIILVGVGSYAYTTQTPTTADTSPTSQTTVNTNPGGIDYHPTGDMAPTPETPIDTSGTSTTSASTTSTVHFSR